MHTSGTAYCGKCGRLTPHVVAAKNDHWGTLSKAVERCQDCLSETTPGNGHEAPLADPPPVTEALTDTEIRRLQFVRHLIYRGALTEWPRDWWDATPGGWG